MDVYAEFGLYEAHVEGMRPSNSMIVEGCGDLEYLCYFLVHVVFFFAMQVAM